MLLSSHNLYYTNISVVCSRQFFPINKASLQRTSTIILLMFDNVVNKILFVLLKSVRVHFPYGSDGRSFFVEYS